MPPYAVQAVLRLRPLKRDRFGDRLPGILSSRSGLRTSKHTSLVTGDASQEPARRLQHQPFGECFAPLPAATSSGRFKFDAATFSLVHLTRQLLLEMCVLMFGVRFVRFEFLTIDLRGDLFSTVLILGPPERHTAAKTAHG